MKRACPSRRRQREVRQHGRHHGVYVRRHVVLPAIEQVLEMKAGFRFALHRQPALKEQRIRIFLTPRQRDEIAQRPAHRDMRRQCGATQPRGGDLEGHGERYVVDAQAETLAGQLAQLRGERLASQQMTHGERHGARVNGFGQRQRAQQNGNEIEHGLHGQLQGWRNVQRVFNSCHDRASHGLSYIKARGRHDL